MLTKTKQKIREIDKALIRMDDKKKSISLYFFALLFVMMPLTSLPGLCDAQEEKVEQKTTGDQSPNIYAPGGNITIIYEMSGNALELQAKLDDAIKEKESLAKINDELKKKLADITSSSTLPTPATDKIEPLMKFTHQEFIDNFAILYQYNEFRKTGQLINPDRLIEVLNGYFRSVLLYPSPDTKKYYITDSKGRLLLLQLLGHNEKNEAMSLSMPDIFASLLSNVCTDFIKSAEPRHYNIMNNLFDRALSTPGLDNIQKIIILDAKSFILKNKLLLNM